MSSAISSSALTGQRLLLVNDCQGLRARKCLLEEGGFLVEAVCDPAVALQYVLAGQVDLVVTDHKPPAVDGLALIAMLRQQRPQLPIILLSGVADALGLNENNTGATIVLQKGANEVTHLLRSVSRLLQRKVARKPPASLVAAAGEARRKTV